MKEGTAENYFPPELEQKFITKIILEFMRHGKKEKDKTKTDQKIHLTREGKLQAYEKGKSFNPQIRVAVAKGSPRIRTQETSGHVMLANEEKIDPESTLEDMEKIISQEIKIGTKIVEDERLDFNEAGPIGKELDEAYDKGEMLNYIINQSDRRAIETSDKVSSTYLRRAGNIAEIVNGYCQMGNNFHKIAEKNSKYAEYGNQLERYLGTHQAISESFIAKVLEKTKSADKRDEFIKAIGGGGFKESQGMRVEIINSGNEQEILIEYELPDKEGTPFKETLRINGGLLEEIIKEREEFEKKVMAEI